MRFPRFHWALLPLCLFPRSLIPRLSHQCLSATCAAPLRGLSDVAMSRTENIQGRSPLPKGFREIGSVFLRGSRGHVKKTFASRGTFRVTVKCMCSEPAVLQDLALEPARDPKGTPIHGRICGRSREAVLRPGSCLRREVRAKLQGECPKLTGLANRRGNG